MQQVLVPLVYPRKACPWESPCASERTRYGCERRHIWVVVVSVRALLEAYLYIAFVEFVALLILSILRAIINI